VALKVMKLKEENLIEVLEELATHKNCSHKNIVAYYSSYFIEEDLSLWISLEYMPGGTLTDLIKQKAPLPEPFIAFVGLNFFYFLFFFLFFSYFFFKILFKIKFFFF
jgi:serine/threonine protein kinase